MTLLGIDISGPINYAQAVQSGQQFVYHQATDGVGSPNGHIRSAFVTLRGLGLSDLGAYMYLRCRHGGRTQDADEQVKEFLDLRAQSGATLPILLDIEGGDPAHDRAANLLCTPDEIKAGVLLALESLERLAPDVSKWVYTDKGEADAMHLGDIAELKAYPLLVAAYVALPGIDTPCPTGYPHIPAPWTTDDVIGWQYVGDVLAFGGGIDRIRLDFDDINCLRQA